MPIVETRSGSTKLACAVEDPHRRARCALPPGHRGRHEDSWGKRFDAAKQDSPTGGTWRWACDSYGKVRHSKKACVYTKVTGPDGGELLVTVAGRIENWQDAKLIALAPAMHAAITAVLHQLENGEASDVLAGEQTRPDAVRDLCWCRDQLKQALNSDS